MGEEAFLEMTVEEFVEAYSEDPTIWGYLTDRQQTDLLEEFAITWFLLHGKD